MKKIFIKQFSLQYSYFNILYQYIFCLTNIDLVIKIFLNLVNYKYYN